MSPVTILLRVVFGVILATGLAMWGGIGFPVDLVFVMSVGVMSAIWGDKFILGFMTMMRYVSRGLRG
jgi:hypothetical protein